MDDTLYRRGVDAIFFHFLNQEKDEVVLNEFHNGECGRHLSELAKTQRIL
jgi:hypothetical protein